MKQKIVLKQTRDFSETLETTFAFFKQNFKTLAKTILIYIGPLILINAIVSSLFMLKAGNFAQILSGTAEIPPFVFATYLLALVIMALLTGIVSVYVKLYADRQDIEQDPITVDELWEAVKPKFMKMLGAVLLSGVLALIGFVLFIIPGLWVAASMSLVFMVVANEDLSAGSAISRSVQLVSGAWWRVFGLGVVLIGILGLVLSMIALPVTGLMAATTMAGFSGEEVGMSMHIALILATLVQGLVGQLLYALLYIGAGVLYYTRLEEKEGAGLVEDIDNINRP